jgi:hypothetical protein
MQAAPSLEGTEMPSGADMKKNDKAWHAKIMNGTTLRTAATPQLESIRDGWHSSRDLRETQRTGALDDPQQEAGGPKLNSLVRGEDSTTHLSRHGWNQR